MLLEPTRKQYKLPIKSKLWVFFLVFWQATADNTDEYYEIISHLINDEKYKSQYIIYWSNFFENSFVVDTRYKRLLKLYYKRFFINTISLYHRDYDENLYKNITERLHKIYISKYTKNIRAPKSWKRLFSVSKKILSEFLGVPVYKVSSEFTKEQISYYYDCMTRDYYDTFKQGIQENKTILYAEQWGLTQDQKDTLSYIKKHSTAKK